MAPRPVIPATTHVEALSSHAVKDAPHPVIPAVTEKSTTTTHHADSAPKIAHVAVPIVAAAAAVPLVENARTTTTTTSHDNKPNVVQSASRPIIPVVTPAPTNTYNSVPIQQQRQQQVNTQRASATDVEFADKIAAAIPESYHGPVPNLQPGEEIVWVKTVTTTDYYDDNSPPVVTNINNTVAAGGPGGNAHPAPLGVPANAAHDNSTQRRSSGGFLDRLTHRHHDNVDKGKQRM
ncbi:MAG: hypothetical protein J3R72DRAFT_436677 [Linnemannia gamsii]|nr:MAG: hypothetical protein J3R72DRAFT_436677 [Linnemannia gamsii]